MNTANEWAPLSSPNLNMTRPSPNYPYEVGDVHSWSTSTPSVQDYTMQPAIIQRQRGLIGPATPPFPPSADVIMTVEGVITSGPQNPPPLTLDKGNDSTTVPHWTPWDSLAELGPLPQRTIPHRSLLPGPVEPPITANTSLAYLKCSPRKIRRHYHPPVRPSHFERRQFIEAIITRLKITFKDTSEYRWLLRCKGSQAQVILDLFQTLLDQSLASDNQFRRHLIVAMRRLSQKSGLYPCQFDLKNIRVLGDHAIAAGSFADIYKGEFHGEHVCLKVIRVYRSTWINYIVKLFARESILWGQLSHPNILPFYGLYWFRSQLSFVSPWADNGHVVDFLKEHPSQNRILLCADMAAGVAYLHENNIIHGDLKGMNVLVDGSGRACLADFGLSAITDPEILHWTSQSLAASQGGTIRWQAPELHEPESEDDVNDKAIHNTKESDIYAWACVCYEIFTERVPFFESLRDATVITKVSRGERPSRPSSSSSSWLEWGLTWTMWALMEDCWGYKPEDRPNISTIVQRLNLERPPDHRPAGRWIGSAMRFRCASNTGYSLLPLAVDLDTLLSS